MSRLLAYVRYKKLRQHWLYCKDNECTSCTEFERLQEIKFQDDYGDYYNDGGVHDNCTQCGEKIQFTSESIQMLKSGNILYPHLMPFKKRKTMIKKWKCTCGRTGKNLYLMEE